MITPLDIQNKEFTKGLRGYKEVEVDEFLDNVIDSYEKVYMKMQK
jgi:cell division initiation protein